MGWYTFVDGMTATNLTTSQGASLTEGHSCPGALQLIVNFTGYGGAHEAGFTEFYFGFTPNGRDWSAYKNLHAFVKLVADYREIDSVFFYVKSGMQMKYQSATATGVSLSNGQWQELVIDLTNVGGPSSGVAANDVQQMGFEVLLKAAAPTAGPATPTQAFLYADDIYLEAKPPSDGGTSDAASDGASD